MRGLSPRVPPKSTPRGLAVARLDGGLEELVARVVAAGPDARTPRVVITALGPEVVLEEPRCAPDPYDLHAARATAARREARRAQGPKVTPRGQALDHVHSPPSADVAARHHEKVYCAFVEKIGRAGPIRVAEIPFPPDSSDLPSLLRALDLPQDNWRVRYHVLVRRWHPDKFMQRWGERLDEPADARARATQISQRLVREWSSLQ